MDVAKQVKEALSKYGVSTDGAYWQHKQSGNWIAKHKALEALKDAAGITFELPTVIIAEPDISVLLVRGALDKKQEWSIGEAKPDNITGKYPYAMAEKRAKDRVILKLLGLHGYVYSEEEADDFKNTEPATQELSLNQKIKDTKWFYIQGIAADIWEYTDLFDEKLKVCKEKDHITAIKSANSILLARIKEEAPEVHDAIMKVMGQYNTKLEQSA